MFNAVCTSCKWRQNVCGTFGGYGNAVEDINTLKCLMACRQPLPSGPARRRNEFASIDRSSLTPGYWKEEAQLV